jgi:dolichol-phosphate mannosyltransferase
MSSAAAKHDNNVLAVATNDQAWKHALFPAMKSVTIIVPTRNEVENIGPLVSQIVASAIPFHEILFVDDGSIDGTRELILSLSSIHSIRLIDQDRAMPGLAAAVMAGARAAEGRLLLIMDADLSHPPERIKDLLGPLLNGTADMVIGSRYVEGGSTAHWPLWRRTLSRAGSALAYSVTGVRDSMCGFFAIECARLLEIAPPAVGFKLAFETIVRADPPLRVCEIPIEFRDRVRGQSKMSLAIAIRFFGRWLLAVLRRSLARDFHSSERDRSAQRWESDALSDQMPERSAPAFALPSAIDK